jgi:hypothetical protein
MITGNPFPNDVPAPAKANNKKGRPLSIPVLLVSE